MSGWRATGRLGAADKRPAARTPGQDSGDKAPSKDVGLQGRRALLLPGGGGRPGLRPEVTPPRLGGFEGGPPSSSPPRTLSPPPAPPPARSRTSLEPVPYTAKRGEGQGPPDTAALRHETPPPARDPGQGRGTHFLYLAGLDPILSRGGLQSPHPPPHSIPWSCRVWLGVPLSLFPSFVSVAPSVVSVLRPSLFVSYFSVPSSLLPLNSRIASSLLVSPDYISPVHILPGRSHWKDQTLPYSFLLTPK